MLNYKVTNEQTGLMADIQQDKRAFTMLKDRSLRHNIYQTLEQYGDPRRWPEYLEQVHEVVELD